jgi:GH25 family lysozyme M1 (1,4-beta-N-acetylmuramidase)
MKKDFDSDDFDFEEKGGIGPIAIGGAVILLVLVIGIIVLLIQKPAKPLEENDNLFEEVESGIEISTELASDEEVALLTSDESSESSSEGNSGNNIDEAGNALSVENSDGDLQESVKSATGAEVDITQIVSASSVSENSNITNGIDVSRFQGTIDWGQVAGSGIDFAMVRVGYRDSRTGEIKADTNAKFNMQEAEKNGIKVGAYFFSTAVSNAEAVEEANWVTNYIAKYSITYPVGYNCEGFENAASRQVNLTQDERSAIALTFLDTIYKAGYTPIFYASRSELAGDAKWNTSQIQQKYKIWLAWYDQDTGNLAKGPAYDGQCAMWQYTSMGTVPGINGKVDIDVAYFGYNGTETAKDTSERETASADVEALMNFDAVDETVTAKNSTNLRNKPSQGSDSTVMVTLENGQTAQRTGVSASGWSRVIYEGNTYYAVSSFLTTDLSAPKQESAPAVQETSGFKTKFTDCSETVTAKDVVNLRNKPSVTDEDSQVIASLSSGETALRTGINNEYGWSRVEYNGQTLYCVSSYLRVVE